MSPISPTSPTSPLGTRGGAAVEFALVLPLLFALVGLGLAIGVQLTIAGLLEHAAERAARQVAVTRGPLSDPSPASVAFLITPTTADVEPEAAVEGDPFAVELTYDWDNPAWGLVRVLTGGSGTTSISASAGGIREWD